MPRIKHGMTNTPTYSSWVCMKSRCNNPNDSSYERYGGKKIKVCKRWNNFKEFFSDMGERPKGKTLDRINTKKGYTKLNCRWATISEQNFNKRLKGKGVSYSKSRNKWRSYICLGNRKVKWIGEYDTKEAAVIVTAKAIKELE